MKPVDFDFTRQRWDEYRAFHTNDGHIVQFATGECIYTRPNPDPHERRHFRARMIQSVGTDDSDLPDLYLPGDTKPLPKAWLNNNGMQYLMVDYDRDKAVRLFSYGATMPLTIPTHLRQRNRSDVRVYWAGPGCDPIGASILISQPFVPLPEQRAAIRALRDQCTAWVAMQDFPAEVWRPIVYKGEKIAVPSHAVGIDQVLDKSITDLTVAVRVQFVRHGHVGKRVNTTHPYLSLSPAKS
jgi:hypothetical protein